MAISQANTNDENSTTIGLNAVAGAVNLQASITMACRVRFASTATTDNQTMIGYAINSGTDVSGFYMARIIGQTANTFSAYRSNPTATTLNTATSGTGAAPNTTTWVHLACVYTAGSPGTIQCYINGVASGSAANSNATLCTSSTNNSVAFVWGMTNAVLADAVIIGRALTAAEVLRLSRTRLVTVMRGDGILWVPANASGSITDAGKDYSGRGNHLVAVSGTGAAPVVSTEAVPVPWGARRAARFYVPSSTFAVNTPTGVVALTGAAATGQTAQQGSASGPTLLSGAAAVQALAAIQASGTVNLSGATAIAASAPVAPSGTVLLTGTAQTAKTAQSGTAAASTLLTGAAATASSAAVAAPASTLLTGSAAVGASLPVNTPSGTVLLSGAAATAATAAANAAATTTLTGAAATSSSAPVSSSGTVTLSGAVATASSAALAPTGTALLTGAAATASSATASAAGTVQLTGVAAMGASGAASINTPTGTVQLTGAAMTSSQGAVAAPATTLLSGQAALASTGSIAGQGDTVLSGTALMSQSRAFIASANTLLSGTSAIQAAADFATSGTVRLFGSCAMTGGTPTPPSGRSGPGYYKNQETRRGVGTQRRRPLRWGR